MKKILLSIGALAIAGVVVVGATSAIFSDEEISTGNTFTAGAIDLKVDSECTYNGEVSEQCGTWGQPDGLDIVSEKFFNFTDIKPGDEGENTISLHVLNNDAYVCAIIDNMKNDDLGITEPEAEDGDKTDGPGNGELAGELNFFAWADDGNNIWEAGESTLFSNVSGPASDVLNSKVYPLYTPATSALAGGTTAYIGLYWCYGDLTVDQGANTLSCSGASVTNLSQSDSLSADIAFVVEQARNNENFTCPAPDQRPSVGASITAYSEPSPNSCDYIVDATSGSYLTVQSGVDAASSGDTVCVETGTYDESVTVDKDITIVGLHSPYNSGKATIDGQITVTSEGVAVKGLEVVNEGGSYAVYLNSVGEATVSDNYIHNIGTTRSSGSAQGVYIRSAGATVSNIAIKGNKISDIGNLSMLHGGSAGSGAKGVYIGTTSGSGSISNVTIENNEITNLNAATVPWVSGGSGGAGAYGVAVNFGPGVSGLTVTQNTISNLEGLWAHAVGLETGTPNASITLNDISDLTDHKSPADAIAVFLEDNNDGSTVSVNQNNLAPSVAWGVVLHPTSASGNVDAKNNWWGDTNPSDNVFGTVDYTSFETSAFPTN